VPDAPTSQPPAFVVLWDGTDAAPWGRYLADDLRPGAAAPACPQAPPPPPARTSGAPDTWSRLQRVLSAHDGRPLTAHELARLSGVAPAVTHAALTYRVRVGHVAVAGPVPRTAAAGFGLVRAFVLTERGRG
jgi:hypothetical protein